MKALKIITSVTKISCIVVAGVCAMEDLIAQTIFFIGMAIYLQFYLQEEKNL